MRFCVLNFNCEMGRHRKGLPSGERLNKNSIQYFAHIYKRKEDASTLLTHPQYDWLNERIVTRSELYTQGTGDGVAVEVHIHGL